MPLHWACAGNRARGTIGDGAHAEISIGWHGLAKARRGGRADRSSRGLRRRRAERWGPFRPARANRTDRELDAQTIYQQGEAQLERGRPDNAAELFVEVERLHPYSEWAKRGLIMAAFSYHQDRDYDNARIAAQRFSISTRR
jgi:hypothetical protein